MAYKQPGFGNGEKASMIHSSPLNISRRKRMREAREKEGRVDDRSGVTISRNQYAGKTNKQIKKLKEKAAKKASKAEERAAGGKKLSKRQRDAIAERDYNIKRESEKSKALDQRAKNEEIYGKPTSVKTREKLDQKAMEQDYQEQQVAGAEASANRFRPPGLVASEKRDPAEANMPDVDLVENKPKRSNYTKVVDEERSGRAGHTVYHTQGQMRDKRSESLRGDYDEMGVREVWDQDQKTGKWSKKLSAEKGSFDRRNKALEDAYASGQFGKDVQFPVKEDGSKDYQHAYRTWKGFQ